MTLLTGSAERAALFRMLHERGPLLQIAYTSAAHAWVAGRKRMHRARQQTGAQ